MKTVSNWKGRAAVDTKRGFSLIELMIVIAIISILAAIAVPSYQRYVIRTHRTEAMSALQGLAQAMERYYVQQQPNTYVGAANAAGVPTIFNTTSPSDGGTARYNLLITAASTTAYTLSAAPINAQAADGFIQLDSTGRRAWDKDNSGAISASEFTWKD